MVAMGARRRKDKSGMRKGRITRNPFLNFLREYRKGKDSRKMTSVASQAANKWKRLSEAEKRRYRKQAARAPPEKRRRIKKNGTVKERRPEEKEQRIRSKSKTPGRYIKRENKTEADTLASLSSTFVGPSLGRKRYCSVCRGLITDGESS